MLKDFYKVASFWKSRRGKGGEERAEGEIDEKQTLLTVFKLYKRAWNEFPESKGQETH